MSSCRGSSGEGTVGLSSGDSVSGVLVEASLELDLIGWAVINGDTEGSAANVVSGISTARVDVEATG